MKKSLPLHASGALSAPHCFGIVRKLMLSLLLIAAAFPAFAEYVTVNGIQYDYDTVTGTAKVDKGLYCGGDITLPESITADGVTYPVTEIAREAFKECIYITSMIIPETVTKIEDYAFEGCSALESVVIFGPIQSIEHATFYRCSSLTSITLPVSIKKIDDEAFLACDNLKEVHISDLSAWCKIEFDSAVYFYGGSHVKPEINEEILDTGNPLQFGGNLYLGDELITDLVIPDDIQNLPMAAFAGCNSLKSVTVPNTVTEIGRFAFYGCDNLQSVSLPDSLDELGTYAFYCNNLTEVSCAAEKPPFIPSYTVMWKYEDQKYRVYDAFKNYNATLTVPAGSVQLYREDPLWGKFYVTAGADDLPADEQLLPTDYFNLNGIKVGTAAPGENNPGLPSGVYITRQGTKTAKVVIP